MDEGDRALAHVGQLRAQVAELFDNLDEILAEMTDDELREFLALLQSIRRNRERGGHSLN
ncbi:hypothetical protein [Mycolicibacterium porcinum]|uniref:hypothetical protein n=1 Tax=Mycolicibacterium porcinum TaxID=39693 RepID=UPI0010427022|nr:hypothetical protein [Mycolicibacterium porcinum]